MVRKHLAGVEGVDSGILVVGAGWCGHGLFDVYSRSCTTGLLSSGLWDHESGFTSSSVGFHQLWVLSADQKPYALGLSSVHFRNELSRTFALGVGLCAAGLFLVLAQLSATGIPVLGLWYFFSWLQLASFGLCSDGTNCFTKKPCVLRIAVAHLWLGLP